LWAGIGWVGVAADIIQYGRIRQEGGKWARDMLSATEYKCDLSNILDIGMRIALRLIHVFGKENLPCRIINLTQYQLLTTYQLPEA
jgi:hypothetical protein